MMARHAQPVRQLLLGQPRLLAEDHQPFRKFHNIRFSLSV